MPSHIPHTCRRRVSHLYVSEGESSGSPDENRLYYSPHTVGRDEGNELLCEPHVIMFEGPARGSYEVGA